MNKLDRQKLDCYNENKIFLKNLSKFFADKFNLDPDDLFSELNLVFCEIFEEFDIKEGTKFRTYLRHCCLNRIKNILRKKSAMKHKMEEVTDLDLAICWSNPLDSLLVYDHFVNNENKVIRKISRIVSIYTLPKTNFREWLMIILQDFFTVKEIKEAYKILNPFIK